MHYGNSMDHLIMVTSQQMMVLRGPSRLLLHYQTNLFMRVNGMMRLMREMAWEYFYLKMELYRKASGDTTD